MKQMTAKRMITVLQRLVKEHGDLPLVYIIDDEGNGYNKVFYGPNAGEHDGYEFSSQENSDSKPNAICIN